MWMIWLTLACSATSTLAHVSFTNLKCESHDKKFAQFETCHIKAVNRTHKYIDIYAKLKVVPVSKVELKLEPMRYDNGYNHFLLPMTFDLCKFLKNPTAKSMIILKEIYSTFVNVSNMNHTCPYDHDIIVSKMFTGNLEKGFTSFLPIPHGDYAIFSKWYTRNILRATVNIYLQITK
ncbi:uncharacterized protein LOC110190735 [Drosophila serrata]|uniref:uncharacterized protein LOC110190735 n=1 Tax=Drosophila serrata TaxID=7274 RepID=UPI000A1D36A5|nr:uncharacterized protein LOC110190735 [Drosophila serrata]